MLNKPSKPVWLVPLALVTFLFVVLGLETQDGLPTWANEIALIALVLIFFGGLMLWVKLDAPALQEEEMNKQEDVVYHWHIFNSKCPTPNPAPNDSAHPSRAPTPSKN